MIAIEHFTTVRIVWHMANYYYRVGQQLSKLLLLHRFMNMY